MTINETELNRPKTRAWRATDKHGKTTIIVGEWFTGPHIQIDPSDLMNDPDALMEQQ